MTPRVTPDTDDRVFACPDCDEAGDVYRREAANRTGETEYRCHRCGALFDAPVERPSQYRIPDAETADGLPCGLSKTAKERIRAARRGDT